jgi:ABC-type Mn2+/Zn2+ transport system permease subunit
MSALTEPLAYGFFVRALGAGLLVGAMCGALSVFIVLRRMSYIGHGLAHSVLGGAVVGLALGYNLYVGMIAATALSAVLIDRVSRRRGLYVDSAIGIVTTAMFGLGVAIVSIVAIRVNLEALLFGNILAVQRADLMLAATVATAFALVVATSYKALVFATFDPEVASVQGVLVGRYELGFNLLTAGVVIASVRVLGVLLIAAAVVVPAATARLLTRSMPQLFLLATVFGVVFAATGLYGSFHMNVPTGPAIVLTGAAVFGVTFAGTAIAGFWRSRRRTPVPAPAGR